MHLKEEIASQNSTVAAFMGGMNPRHAISTALAATAEDANGNPFNGSWVVATGNLVSDMYANVAAESSGRLLATRLWEITDDPGMKDTLSFLIARDTMHQNQWLAVIEEINQPLPVPSDFPQSQEKQEFSYQYFLHSTAPVPSGSRFAHGPSIDGKGTFEMVSAKPFGPIPQLPEAPDASHTKVMPKLGAQATNAAAKVSETAQQVISKITGSDGKDK
jgi:Mn-containing catalase